MEKYLDELKPGDSGVVVSISSTTNNSLRRRMLDMGITIGAEIEVLRVAPFGDPIDFKVKGYQISLRKSEAHSIRVEVKG